MSRWKAKAIMDTEEEILKPAQSKKPVKKKRWNKSRVLLPRDTTLKFIKLVERTPCLWNRSDPAYKMRMVKESAWHDLSEEIDVPVQLLKEKWHSLKCSLRSFSAKRRNRKANQIVPMWYAYDALHFTRGGSAAQKILSASSVNGNETAKEKEIQSNGESPEREEIVPKNENDEDDEYGDCEITEQDIMSGMAMDRTENSSIAPSSDIGHQQCELEKNSTHSDLDRSKLFGQSVSLRMANFSVQQRSFAEKMINDILFEGEQSSLTIEHVYGVEREMQRLRSEFNC